MINTSVEKELNFIRHEEELEVIFINEVQDLFAGVRSPRGQASGLASCWVLLVGHLSTKHQARVNCRSSSESLCKISKRYVSAWLSLRRIVNHETDVCQVLLPVFSMKWFICTIELIAVFCPPSSPMASTALPSIEDYSKCTLNLNHAPVVRAKRNAR
jgi:hypothetical protein